MKLKSLKWISATLALIINLAIFGVAYSTPAVTVSISPEEVTANPKETFTISVEIKDVVDLYAWGLKIRWEWYMLECIEVIEGPFLKQGGDTAFVCKIYDDYIDVGDSLLGVDVGVSGSGTLMYAKFNVTEAGETILDLFDVTLLNSTLHAIEDWDYKDSPDDSLFYTTARADLVRRSAWPEHHHYDISMDEDSYQTLHGLVRNLGPTNLYVKVIFKLIRDDGVPIILETPKTLTAPDEIVELTVDFGPISGEDIGKYYVEATCCYSYYGLYFSPGKKIKTFSFSIVA